MVQFIIRTVHQTGNHLPALSALDKPAVCVRLSVGLAVGRSVGGTRQTKLIRQQQRRRRRRVGGVRRRVAEQTEQERLNSLVRHERAIQLTSSNRPTNRYAACPFSEAANIEHHDIIIVISPVTLYHIHGSPENTKPLPNYQQII